MTTHSGATASERVELIAVPGIPRIAAGDDLGALIADVLERQAPGLRDGDVVCVSSKLVSRAEARGVALRDVQPSDEAVALAQRVGRPAPLVELVLRESVHVSRAAPGVLVVRSRLGHVSANAGIDLSNTGATGEDEVALLLPRDPDTSADRIRETLNERLGVTAGVIVTDSFGRPFRVGTVGVAIGVSGVTAVADYRGRTDLDGRELRVTIAAVADQIAAAADMVAGQGSEGRGVIVVRGMRCAGTGRSADLLRDPRHDLYA